VEKVTFEYGNSIVDFYLIDLFTKEQITFITGCDGECQTIDLSIIEAEEKIKKIVSDYE